MIIRYHYLKIIIIIVLNAILPDTIMWASKYKRTSCLVGCNHTLGTCDREAYVDITVIVVDLVTCEDNLGIPRYSYAPCLGGIAPIFAL